MGGVGTNFLIPSGRWSFELFVGLPGSIRAGSLGTGSVRGRQAGAGAFRERWPPFSPSPIFGGCEARTNLPEDPYFVLLRQTEILCSDKVHLYTIAVTVENGIRHLHSSSLRASLRTVSVQIQGRVNHTHRIARTQSPRRHRR